jgi:hypothetical protein
MSVENPENVKLTPEEKELQKAKEKFGSIFEQSKGAERTVRIKNMLQAYVDLKEVDMAKIFQEVEAAEDLDDKQEYIEQIIAALQPFADLKKQKPEFFEKKERENFIKREGFMPLNEIFSYGLGDNGWIHIHHAPARTMPLEERAKLAVEALHKLAQLAEKNPKIKGITATSWIVAKRPEWLTSLGFTITGPVDQKFRDQYFKGEEGPIDKAVLTREELLQKYL